MYCNSLLLFVVLIEGFVHGADNFYETCDKLGIHYYEERGCKAVGKAADGICPQSYDCPKYEIPEGKCLFDGKEYNKGEVASGSYCNKGCFCTGSSSSDQNSRFNCGLIIDCYFGPMDPGCYRHYALRQCCPTIECPETPRNVTCEVDGKTYYDGDVFSPKDTCWTCVCKPGFEGKYEEPFCIRRPCDSELRFSEQIQKKCAPIYRKIQDENELCCPQAFACSDELTNLHVINEGSNSEAKCKFGDTEYNIGAVFNGTLSQGWVSETTCECRVPPYMSCTS